MSTEHSGISSSSETSDEIDLLESAASKPSLPAAHDGTIFDTASDESERLRRDDIESNMYFQSLDSEDPASIASIEQTKAAAPPEIGKDFDNRFTLLEKIGEGAMGTVFKAEHWALKRIVALKILKTEGKDAGARIQRFQQEARVAAGLNHPNIIKVHDLHTSIDGEPYIQFEFVDGCPLSSLLRDIEQKGYFLPVKRVLDIAIQSLNALDCLHKNKITHRDVKPSNIMLQVKRLHADDTRVLRDSATEDEHLNEIMDSLDTEFDVKLVDFGLAKIRDQDDNTQLRITRKGQAVGTVAYMSPEQCFADKVDGRADIYSLGCVLYEMLVGAVPFIGEDARQTMYMHRDEIAAPVRSKRPDLPFAAEFERIVSRMLAKSKDERYQSAQQVKNDFKRILDSIAGGDTVDAFQSTIYCKRETPKTKQPDLQSTLKSLNTEANSVNTNDTVTEAIPDALSFKPSNTKAETVTNDVTQQDPERVRIDDDLHAGEVTQQDQNSRPQPIDRKNAQTAQQQPPASAEKKVWADPLAPDSIQQSVASEGVSARKDLPEFNSAQSTRSKISSSRGFSENDLFANKYEIRGHIGQGGMGVVYKAFDLILERPVAIKFLKSKSGINQLEMNRFQQEAKAIASLNHTNIIRVYEMSVTADGDPYFVLEYLEGHPLSAELKGRKYLPLERAISILSQVCDALQHAHQKGVIHRDIKPSNLMIVPEADGTEQVKLLDFGIAKLNPMDEETLLKLTKTGELFGSPHYMSPEQCSGKNIAAPSDIYSLGCVFYEMLCGVPPFSGQNALDTLDKHKNADVPSVTERRNDLPHAKQIDSLLQKMMMKDPDARLQTPAEVKKEIAHLEKQLKGNVFEQFRRSAFPNGLSDSRGKKNAVLAMVATVAVAGAIVAITQYPSSKSVPLPAVSADADKTDWKTYDLYGQQLFDQGSYKEAEDQYQEALKKAESETGNTQLMHKNTTLRELRILYHAMENKPAFDRINRLLLDTPAAASPKELPSWDKLLANAEQANDSKSLKSIVDSAIELSSVGDEESARKNTHKMLAALSAKMKGKNYASIAIDELKVLDAMVSFTESTAVPHESVDAIHNLLKNRPEDLTPQIVAIIVEVGVNQGMPFNAFEELLEFGWKEGSRRDRPYFGLRLSEILWKTDRRIAAKKIMSRALVEAETQLPRDFSIILRTLHAVASCEVQERREGAAIPLLLRCKAISECEQISSGDGRNVNDLITAELAEAYAGCNKFEEAERTLESLVESCERAGRAGSLQKAQWLAYLGKIYSIDGKLTESKDCLQASIRIFRNEKNLTSSNRDAYQGALKNLEYTQTKLRRLNAN